MVAFHSKNGQFCFINQADSIYSTPPSARARSGSCPIDKVLRAWDYGLAMDCMVTLSKGSCMKIEYTYNHFVSANLEGYTLPSHQVLKSLAELAGGYTLIPEESRLVVACKPYMVYSASALVRSIPNAKSIKVSSSWPSEFRIISGLILPRARSIQDLVLANQVRHTAIDNGLSIYEVCVRGGWVTGNGALLQEHMVMSLYNGSEVQYRINQLIDHVLASGMEEAVFFWDRAMLSVATA